MKITAEMLKAMGFERQKNTNDNEIDEWRMKLNGYYFVVKNGPDFWDYFSPGSYNSHTVSDMEELLSMTHVDAYEAGKEANKEALREFLGVKKG